MDRTSRSILWGGAILVVGLIFLLRNLGVLPFELGSLWPLILIIIGLSLVYKFFRHPTESRWSLSMESRKTSSDQGLIHLDKTFGDIDLDFENRELKGGSINLWVGDMKLDLSKAILPEGESQLRVSCWIGDVKVYLPKETSVSATATVLLGDVKVMGEKASGFNCEVEVSHEGYDEAANRLKVDASLLLGDIKLF